MVDNIENRKDSFVLRSLDISNFRNLHNIRSMSFARRINVISGQNGVGKSNILALIASGTGNTKMTNTLGNSFQPEFSQYFMIYPEETVTKDDDPSKRYFVYAHYSRERDELTITKRLSLKNNPGSEGRKVQIVPRTVITDEEMTRWKHLGYSTKTSVIDHLSKNEKLTPAARLPVPTIYDSIARLYPLGELNSAKKPTNEAKIRKLRKTNKVITNDLNKDYASLYNAVLPDSVETASLENDFGYYVKKENTLGEKYTMPIRNTRELSRSVGQDSLGVIISNLIDFDYLKKTNKSYSGGILCIDEADTSLHPAAQKNCLILSIVFPRNTISRYLSQRIQ